MTMYGNDSRSHYSWTSYPCVTYLYASNSHADGFVCKHIELIINTLFSAYRYNYHFLYVD